MASSSIWAIDIGTNSLKALRLSHGQDGFEVTGFDFIEHSRIISAGDVSDDNRRAIIDETLEKFLDQNKLDKDEVAISISGQNSFARFIKLPPVEKKRIPEIVQFEAVQQIPFEIDDVEWDWQLMGDPDSPDAEVGIFAIKNELISEVMDHFTRKNIKVSCVQISPMALYNFCLYDQKMSEKATVILDMGAENTTLVVCTKTMVWQRNIRIAGNAFTEAIAETFKLKFAKAERLKRTAPMSKYVRQIFTAMKPVFTDLSSEIQRSLGFYSSSGAGRDKGFSKVIALGGGMKLQGLAKYLQQTLGVPVVKPESFGKLSVSSDVSSAKFHENISDFGVVYGLGLQMFEEAKIQVNLLPLKIARAMAWSRKGKFFTIAACTLLAVSVLSMLNVIHNKNKYDENDSIRRQIASTINAAKKAESSLRKEAGRNSTLRKKIDSEMILFSRRDVVPVLNQMIISCLPNSENNPDPVQKALYEAFDRGDVEGVLSVSREDRKQLFITDVSIRYSSSLKDAKFEEDRKKKKKRKIRGSDFMDTGFIGPMGPGFIGPMGPGFIGPMGPGFVSPGTTFQKSRKKDQPEEKDEAGFVIILEGYSPYKNIHELLNPHGVKDEKDKWGVVTRFENLAKIIPKCKFELFSKDNVDHFKVETGDVEFGDDNTPAGAGIEKEIERVPQQEESKGRSRSLAMMGGYGSMGRFEERITVEQVLVDPMTNEEISKTFGLITQVEIKRDPSLSEKDLGKKKYGDFNNEPKFIFRAHWFRKSAKFVWKDAPKVKSTKSTTFRSPGF